VDLFGFIDIIALKDGDPGVVGVQTTSASNVSARKTKIEGIKEAGLWVGCGNIILVMGFRKNSKGRWVPTVSRGNLSGELWSWDPQEGLE
jgi:hypothetical protein